MKNNNKGFSLVEVIVATMILGIIFLGASGFMVAGSRAYRSLNDTVRLQYASQLVMTQLEEYLVDCSAGAAWDDSTKTLYVVNYDESAASGKTVCLFAWDSTAQTISFNSGTAAEDISGITVSDLMAEHVTDMNVAFSDTQREVTVELQMEENGKLYHAQQVIALRNQPPHGDSWSDLWAKIRT